MSLTDYDKERDIFERLEKLEDLTRENDDYYWELGSGLNDNQDTSDSDYLADDNEPQDAKIEDTGRHR